MGQHDGNPVSDLVHKSRRQKVHKQLDPEVKRDEYGDLAERDLVGTLKGQKQQRDKIIDDRLYDISHKTCIDGFLIFCIHS